MPINRAPFNALVDDSGNGLTGSIWNKAAIAGVLLDPIDALVGTVTAWTPTWKSGAGIAAVGNGTMVALYAEHASLVQFSIHLVWGSTTNAGGTGPWSFTLPFSTRAGTHLWGTGHALGPPYVPVYALGVPVSGGSSEVQPTFFLGGAGTSEVACDYSQPFAWAAGKSLVISGAFFR